MMALLPKPQLAWLLQKRRKQRQHELSPVTYATLSDLASNVSPSLVAHPHITTYGGGNVQSYQWASSDYDVLDFNTDQSPLRFDLKSAGTAEVTLTILNKDGTEFVIKRTYTIV